MQPGSEGAVQVRAIVQGVHLVHVDALQLGRVRLDGVEEDDRLAVGEGHDQVGARLDVVEDSGRRRGVEHRVKVGGGAR